MIVPYFIFYIYRVDYKLEIPQRQSLELATPKVKFSTLCLWSSSSTESVNNVGSLLWLFFSFTFLYKEQKRRGNTKLKASATTKQSVALFNVCVPINSQLVQFCVSKYNYFQKWRRRKKLFLATNLGFPWSFINP